MTTGLTNYAMQRVEDWFLRGTAWASPSPIYLGLDSAIGTISGGGTELTQAGYGRQAITFAAVVSRGITNNSSQSFTAGADWPEAVGWRIWDAPTGGNALCWGPISPRPTVANGATYVVAAGEVSISFPGSYPIGDWYAGRILDKIFRAQAHASLSASLYEHLAISPPALDGSGGTFVTGTGYAPKITTEAAWASGRNYMSGDLTFIASAAAAWGTLAYRCLYDGTNHASDHLLFIGPLVPTFNAGIGAPVVLRSADTYVGLIQDNSI